MTQRMKNRYLSLVLLSLIAMTSFSLRSQGADPRADGIWRAHGYGLILEVHSGKAKLYEVTRISCVPASDEDSSDFDLEKFKEARLSSAGDLLTLYHRNGNVYRYSREPSRPAECENYQATDDPEHNFEIFWNTFEENYAFFHIHNVDWHAAYKVYWPRITPETSPEELLEIFGEMVAPLRDYHASIRTKKKRISHSGYKLRDKVDEVWELVRSKYLKGNYNTRLNQLGHGKLDEKTGYLRIRRMARFTLHHLAVAGRGLTRRHPRLPILPRPDEPFRLLTCLVEGGSLIEERVGSGEVVAVGVACHAAEGVSPSDGYAIEELRRSLDGEVAELVVVMVGAESCLNERREIRRGIGIVTDLVLGIFLRLRSGVLYRPSALGYDHMHGEAGCEDGQPETPPNHVTSDFIRHCLVASKGPIEVLVRRGDQDEASRSRARHGSAHQPP